MSYGRFAYLYDRLMSDMPYEKWLDYMEQFLTKKNIRVLDLACGTGTITEKMLAKGYDVTGVDLSEEMLAVAQDKLSSQGWHIPLFAQNMSQLSLGETFDVVTIFCDSLNYLTTEVDVQKTFAQVYQHLNEGGYFLFDVHSVYKIDEIFIDNTFFVDETEITLLWNCFMGEYPHTVEHEMIFFVKDEHKEHYHRFDELHIQRTFPIEMYEEWLKAVGFEIVNVTAEYGASYVEEHSERVFFAVRKV